MSDQLGNTTDIQPIDPVADRPQLPLNSPGMLRPIVVPIPPEVLSNETKKEPS